MTTIGLAGMAVTMPVVAGHPNRTAFRGVLTVVDAPSQRSPSGAKGHLVVLTKAAAEAALPSLLGMALDYSPTFDRHDVRRKVGVITRAEVVGRKLELGGYLFGRDFPEIVKEIAKASKAESESAKLPPVRSHAPGMSGERGAGWGWREWRRTANWKSSLAATAERLLDLTAGVGGGNALYAQCGDIHAAAFGKPNSSGGLGMSYEVTDVQLADTRARVWTLTRVTFTGAAILRRDKAAYQDTWIELG